MLLGVCQQQQALLWPCSNAGGATSFTLGMWAGQEQLCWCNGAGRRCAGGLPCLAPGLPSVAVPSGSTEVGVAHQNGPEAGQHSEQGTLAAAVGSHDHDAAAGGHIKGQLPHQRSAVRGVQRQPAARNIPAAGCTAMHRATGSRLATTFVPAALHNECVIWITVHAGVKDGKKGTACNGPVVQHDARSGSCAGSQARTC